MNTTKLYTIIIVGILLVLVACNIISPFKQPKIPASIRSIDEDRVVSVSCLPPASTDTLLSVDINGIENCSIPVSSTFDISWKTDNSVPLQYKMMNMSRH